MGYSFEEYPGNQESREDEEQIYSHPAATSRQNGSLARKRRSEMISRSRYVINKNKKNC